VVLALEGGAATLELLLQGVKAKVSELLEMLLCEVEDKVVDLVSVGHYLISSLPQVLEGVDEDEVELGVLSLGDLVLPQEVACIGVCLDESQRRCAATSKLSL